MPEWSLHHINCAARLPEGCGLVIGSTPRSIKNVEPVLLPVPQCKGLRIARLVETSNAESPTQNAIVIPIRYETVPEPSMYNTGCL